MRSLRAGWGLFRAAGRRRWRIWIGNLHTHPHHFAKCLLLAGAHLPETLEYAIGVGSAQADRQVNRLPRLDAPAHRHARPAHLSFGPVAANVGKLEIRLPRARADVAQTPALVELLAQLHDRRGCHVFVVQVQIGYKLHAPFAWRRAGWLRLRRGRIGCRRFGLVRRRHLIRVDLQVLGDQPGKGSICLRLHQRLVQLVDQRGALPGCDGKLLLVEIGAGNLEIAKAAILIFSDEPA